MTSLTWEEVPLAKHHDRAGFDCGDSDLNTYIQRYARQNHDSGGAKCFVAVAFDAPARLLGFYTLSPASIDYSRTPSLAKKDSSVTTCRYSGSVASASSARCRAGAWAGRCCCGRRNAASASRRKSAASRC